MLKLIKSLLVGVVLRGVMLCVGVVIVLGIRIFEMYNGNKYSRSHRHH